MFPTPVSTALKFIGLLLGLLIVGLLLFAPRESSAQEAGPSISIEVDTVEEVHNVSFRFCLDGDDGPLSQCIGLKDGDPVYTFADLDEDTYELAWQGRDGWQVDSFRCSPRDGSNVYVVVADASARIVIDGDDHYACKAVFKRYVPTATPTATATATAGTTATATSVPAVVPTPFVPFACPSGAVVNLAVESCPTPTVAPVVTPPPAPVVPTPITVGRIIPPDTGDAGLVGSSSSSSWAIFAAVGSVAFAVAGFATLKFGRRK